MSAVDDRPMTEREALRAYRKSWMRAGCTEQMCAALQAIAVDYAKAMGIPVEDGLARVSNVLRRQLLVQLDDKVCSILEPNR